MSSFDKFNVARAETVVVGMMIGDRIRIWRDAEPSTWAVKSHKEQRELRDALNHGQISSEAFRDGYYRTTADLDPESMVACFRTHESFGRYGGRSSRGQFVQLSAPSSRRRTTSGSDDPRHPFERAVTAASEFSSRRGDLLIVSGFNVDGPAVTAGTAFRDGRTLSLLSAAPSPGTPRWLDENGERTMLIATLDPYVREEVGELVFDAITAWEIDPWDVVFTFVSPIEQVSGSLIPMGWNESSDSSGAETDDAVAAS
ncbi:hypothetical protein [Gordonia hydrophobica]|uniref:Uncharacterized protein n=1 Tax=Gordonia hydrophobica TaxID=40516 RepID=A0ABZ2TYL4_9ACTN|nr:hypothetical protein [Gordonia hydrophobica]MBM7365830.1 hypothetical protein [Gordonia hydrophobica]